LSKTLVAIVASPTLGFIGGSAIIVAIYWSLYKKSRGRVMPVFKHLQRASAAYMVFSHGRNDAQKPMGVLAMALALHYGWKDVTVPIWIVLSCASVAAVGTAYGGWRIIRTLGMRMTALDPVQGFAAEVAGASVIQGASELGIPISTTHAITSSIIGVGSARRLSAVRWGVTRRIFLSWVLTVPAAMLLGRSPCGLCAGCCLCSSKLPRAPVPATRSTGGAGAAGPLNPTRPICHRRTWLRGPGIRWLATSSSCPAPARTGL
jgi:inorganic phosphate transporter, PiT family